jgi:hypothetical protein
VKKYHRNIKYIILFTVVLFCLIGSGQNNNEMKNNQESKDLAEKLISREYGEFFIYPMHDETIDKIWENTNDHALFDNILSDSSINFEAKFLVCEIFFRKDILFMQRHDPEYIAEIYAQALVQNYTGMANSWGLLYKENDDGTVGVAFVIIGEKSIPALVGLLDNESQSLEYLGSIESTIGNSYKYRIKDFAAYYLGRILAKPLEYFSDYQKRDEQIESLKAYLKTLNIK